jgi:hypothetical protein
MEKEFVPYTLAVELKELGFDEPCFGFFNIKGKFIKDFGITKDIMDSLGLQHLELVGNICVSPTYQQAFRWFREKYNFYNQIHKGYGWEGIVRNSSNGDILWNDGTYNSTEEAELECLKKLIEIVKEGYNG